MTSFVFEEIFNFSPLPIYVLQDGYFRMVNPEMARVTGYTAEELLQIPFTELLYPEERPLVVNQAIRRLAGEDVPDYYEFRAVNRDGDIIHVKGFFSRIEYNGRPAILGQILNITEQKRAEDALRESEEKYRIVIENVNHPILVAQDGVVKFANPKVTEITGYTGDELKSKPFTEFIHPDDRGMVMERFLKRLEGEDLPSIYPFRVIDKLGKIKWLEINSVSVTWEGMPATLSFLPDITERKRAEEKTRLAGSRLEALLKLNHMTELSLKEITSFALEEGVRLTGSDFGYLAFVNEKESLLTMHSWSKEVMGNCSMSDKTLIYPVDKTGLWGEAVRRRKPVITNDYASCNLKKGYPEGHVHLERHMNVPVFDKNRIVMVAGVGNKRDDYEESDVQQLTLLMDGLWRIIRRRQVDEALQESEARLRRITDNMLDVINQIDTAGNIQYISPSCKSVLGYEPGDMIGKSVFDFVHPDDLNEVMNAFYTGIEICSSGSSRFRYRHPDGRLLWLESISNPLLDDKGSCFGVILCTRDITKRKQVEDELILQKAYFQQLFENSPQGIVILDNEDRVINANKGFKELFQFDIEEIKGSYINEMIVPCNLLDEASSFSQAVVAGKVVQKETVRKRKDGSLVNVFILGYPIMAEGKQQGIYAIYSDITERKQAEEQLKYLSLRDPLTGLYNRTFFEREMSRLGAGNDCPLGIILCDVDGLKLVNDTFGHNTGDNLLISAARLIKESFRENDVVARIGGDEFAILLPKSSTLTVESAVRRMRYAVKRYNVKNKLPLSISIGFATSGKESKSPNDLFKEADKNMYREKLHSSQSARSAIVQALMKAMEARDFITEGHADQLQELVSNFAAAYGLSEQQMTDLRLLAKFHDIGKVGIPDRILFKEGSLNWEEVYEMRRHCEIGHRIAKSAPDLVPIADWILKHHERWDGTGYPLGLKEEEIPLECRILAIADAYDAMTSERPYRKSISHEKAVEELIRCSGTQFDPDLLSAFILTLEY